MKRQPDIRPHFVYRCFNNKGILLYVGMSKDVGGRIISHKYVSKWFTEVDHIDIENHTDKLSALTAEMIAIRDELPLYNKLVPTLSRVYNSQFICVYEPEYIPIIETGLPCKQITKGFYSLKELSVILDMSYKFVDKMVKAGNIVVVDMGGEQKIPKQEFDKICKYGIKKLPKKKVVS